MSNVVVDEVYVKTLNTYASILWPICCSGEDNKYGL